MQKGEPQSLPRDVKSLIRLAKEQGWEYSRTSGGHHRLISPEGFVVTQSGTPSDANALWNFRADLKRGGLLPYIPRTPKVSEEKKDVAIHYIPPAPAVKPKRTKNAIPGLRGGRLRDALIEIMVKGDRPQGFSAEDLVDEVSAKMGVGKIPKETIASTLGYWMKETGVFTRVGYGHYRATASVKTSTSLTPMAAKEEDDEKVLIEFLVMLDKVGNIVKRHLETKKALETLMQKLGTTK